LEVQELLEKRILILLGWEEVKKVKKIIFIDNLQKSFKLQKSLQDVVIFIDFDLMKKALQLGEGQEKFDEAFFKLKAFIVSL
jgi:hypothetical protein